MSRLVVVTPSRSRPGNALRLAKALKGTSAELVIAIDDDDPTAWEYHKILKPFEQVTVVRRERTRMIPTLNREALVAVHGGADIVAFLGDDHLPRTPGWDRVISDNVEQPGVGIVYGNDLLQGETLPTAVFMRASIVKALGYMVPPGMVHLFCDDAWLEWGRRAGCLRYLPHVVIEHMHALAGKAPNDAIYQEANSAEQWVADETAWHQYLASPQMEEDVAKIRLAVAGG